MGVHDLKLSLVICDTLRFIELGVAHECGQDAVCTSDGVCAMENLWSHHQSAYRRCWSTHVGMRRLVSGDGVFSADLARIFARHRSVPDGQPHHTVSHGIEKYSG